MERKPDILPAVVLIFAVGLVITGFTSFQASDDSRDSGLRTVSEASQADARVVPVIRGENR